jgi:Glycolipid 2-alpha-mannosyltransferase
MLTTNSEKDIRDTLQSVRQLEDRFNHKYNYPWIFLNDKPFSDEFKSCALSPLAFFRLLFSHMSHYPDVLTTAPAVTHHHD